MVENMRVYLSGPISDVPDDGRMWRSWAERRFDDVDWVNPLDTIECAERDLVVVETSGEKDTILSENPDATVYTANEIVEPQKRMILESDGVLARFNTAVKMTGTPMEIIFAYENGIPVVVWTAESDPDAWLLGNTDYITTNIADAVNWFRDELPD